MEFDFLPKLPSSNLDDRTFDDLVEDCLLRIPRYCPEWTDRNLSDPGVTLIELFAWLTDQMLLRFNQVPRKNYVAFLELLGVRLQAPAPAQTDLTFYLSTDLLEVYTIPIGVEVATIRTENTEAIVFSTDEDLVIGKPSLRHLLSSQTVEDIPQALRERGTQSWTRQTDGIWTGSEQSLFEDQPQAGNCFYLALDAEGPLDGNILAVKFQGSAATPTGIDPKQPPRCWEAWDGETWKSVLLSETDDAAKGFSFYEISQQGDNSGQGGETILHLPQNFPVTTFTSYRGRWLRCRLTELTRGQTGYNRSPRINGVGVRSIGGTVRASHSSLIREERLGISTGKPGQTYDLQTAPILERREDEYIIVIPPGGLPQRWQEVSDFADSRADDRHYTIDSLTGAVQFGPLILEPDRLQRQKDIRAKIQHPRADDTIVQASDISLQNLEYQYGAVPPSGSEIRIMAYRTGGGKQGNVQPGTIQFLKASVPYIARAINLKPATSGADGESLEQAVLRAPKMLRTRDRAVTAEDFEVLARQAIPGAIARSRCLSATSADLAGTVSLLIVPQANTEAIDSGIGITPEQLTLSAGLRHQITAYLDERRLLGVQVRLQEPEYVGVSVQTEIALEPAYDNPLAQQEILSKLRITLYKYLNPFNGGSGGNGWEFGRPVYTSDIVALLQQTPGVRYLGAVLLFPIRKQGDTWVRQTSPEPLIDPGINGLVCSWADNRLRSSHVINIINR